MENLVESGYKPYNRFKSMDWDHGRVGVETLAKFHALSFALEKHDPEEFKKMTDYMVCRTGEDTENQTSIDVWFQMVERSVSILKEEYRDSVRKIVMRPDLFSKYNKPIGRPVLSHGDFRLSNILFKRELLPIALLLGVTILPMVSVESDLVPKIDVGQKRCWHGFFHDEK